MDESASSNLGDAPPGRVLPCDLLVLLRIRNFALLRRHLGKARSATLAEEVRARIVQAEGEGRSRVVGLDTVEVAVGCESRADARPLMSRMQTLLAQPLVLDGETHVLEVLVAGAIADQPPRDEVRLVEEAERALDEARLDREPVLRDIARAAPTIDRLTLAGDLERAVGGDELFLQYQPKVHVRQHRVAGVEALIRWRHPSRGLILPSDFIPVAEQTRAIGAMTLWTIERAIADQRTMRSRGHDLRIFINIAGVLLSDNKFIRRACEMVRSTGATIGFEVTETSVIRDPESAIANLKEVADHGVTISIDDYGAGLSSLAYLKRLPAKELKIDKLFVTQLTSSNRDPLIVRSTIDLAHALEMEVVAEGVENPAALALLGVMGCDMVQGYLISRPINLDALLLFLDHDKHLEVTNASQAGFRGFAGRLKLG